MAMSTVNWVEMQGSIQEIYDAEKKKRVDYSKGMFNFSNSDRDVDKHLGVGGIGLMDEWDGQISEEEINKGYLTTYNQVKYSKAIRLTQDMLQFKNYQRVKDKVTQLAKTVVKTMNYWSAYYINNAWDSSVTGGNSAGVALASNAHRICPGDSTGNQNNTTNNVMNIDNIESMRIAARGWLDDKGQIMDINLDTIICGTYWEKTAMQICGSDKEPFSANNEVNIYRKGASSGLKYMVNPNITGTKWALVDHMEMTGGSGLNWIWGQKPGSPELERDYTTHVATYSTWGWWTHGWDSWFWGYFSQGTT